MSRKKKSLKDLLVLRATYSQELHEAIIHGNETYVKNYIENYDGDDAVRYDMKETIAMAQLQEMLFESDKEYEHAIATGVPIMGM